MSSRIRATILVLAGTPKEVTLPSGSSIKTALEQAGVSWQGYAIQLNGQSAVLSTELNDEAYITLTPNIEGGN